MAHMFLGNNNDAITQHVMDKQDMMGVSLEPLFTQYAMNAVLM
jgi:hypothetical protein